jgi:hypothetical protein
VSLSNTEPTLVRASILKKKAENKREEGDKGEENKTERKNMYYKKEGRKVGRKGRGNG